MGWKTIRRQRPRLQPGGLPSPLPAAARPGLACPAGPTGLGNVRPDLAFNTAVSFVTNTNWQAYGGETTMKYVTQMVGLTVQNFVSAGDRASRWLIALIRGFSRRTTDRLGNFWVDLTRAVLYVLLPLSFVLAIVLVSQGVVQTLRTAPRRRNWCSRTSTADGADGHHADDRGRPGGLADRHQSSWAPTAAASSTPTRRIRSRTPRRSPTSWSWCRSSSSRRRSATPSDAWWATRGRAGWSWRR